VEKEKDGCIKSDIKRGEQRERERERERERGERETS
jgi:hypothetical protein